MEKKHVILEHYGNNTYTAIRIVREATNLDYIDSRKLLGTCPIELCLTDQQILELESTGAKIIDKTLYNIVSAIKQEFSESIDESSKNDFSISEDSLDTSKVDTVAVEYSFPIEVQPKALQDYIYEKCYYISEIITLSKELVETNQINLSGEVGWILCKKRHIYYDPDDNTNYEHEYVLVLDTKGKWKKFHSESLYTNEPYYLECTYDENDFDDFLIEFDFSGFFNYGRNRGNMIAFLKREYSSVANTQYESNFHYSLTRVYDKGKGLLQRLIEIKDSCEQAKSITKPKPVSDTMQNYHNDSKNNQWKGQGRCQYCGGTFKGLFTKKCSNCGRVKDY